MRMRAQCFRSGLRCGEHQNAVVGGRVAGKASIHTSRNKPEADSSANIQCKRVTGKPRRSEQMQRVAHVWCTST
eukprot:11674861-Alexandrium_andersonii.AAC.1